jgi:hypothetical protein
MGRGRGGCGERERERMKASKSEAIEQTSATPNVLQEKLENKDFCV